MAFNIIKLKDMYEAIGETKTQKLLNDFECPINVDVEFFLKQKAVQFLRMGISQTFLVTTTFRKKNVIVGYFSIANKTTIIKKKFLVGNLFLLNVKIKKN